MWAKRRRCFVWHLSAIKRWLYWSKQMGVALQALDETREVQLLQKFVTCQESLDIFTKTIARNWAQKREVNEAYRNDTCWP